MRRAFLAGLLLVSSSVLSGCGLWAISCRKDGIGPLCVLFSGACCLEEETEGVIGCGKLDGTFVYPCGTDGHGGCHCFDDPSQAKSSRQVLQQSFPFATYGTPAFVYAVELPYTGMSSAHRLVFDVRVDDLQTFQGAVTYSEGFTFNGFTALGPPGTQIGSYGFDFGADGSVDFGLPLRALDADTAFVDINLDGQATVIDPTIQHVANVPSPGAHTFNLLLPNGGDAAPNLALVFRAFRIDALLIAGILDNPTDPGSYGISGTFTSVDPDTGDASNGTGPSPMTLNVPSTPITIDESPLELLDHFLCYKAKPSKGNICGPAASANAGGLCTSDAECGVGACIKNKFPKSVQTSLADRYDAFTPRTVDVKKPIRLCTPADKNGEGVNDTSTHLRAFAVKETKGSPKRVASVPLRIVNQLGTLAVTVKAPDSLLEPAAKALNAAAPPLGAHLVDRYQCYKAKVLAKRCAGDPARTCKTDAACGGDGPCLGKFPKGLQVTLSDQFATGKRFDVVKPTRLCTPALANGDPLRSEGGHLMCYKLKPAASEAKHTPQVGVHTTSAIGRDRLDTAGEDELCVPSLELTSVR